MAEVHEDTISSSDDQLAEEYLLAFASALNAHIPLADRVLADFRSFLNASRREVSNESLMLKFARENLELAQYGKVLYGEAFEDNFLKYALSKQVVELRTGLGEIGRFLLSRARLVFNQTAPIYKSDQIVGSSLRSQPYIEAAEKFKESSEFLEGAVKALATFGGIDLAPELAPQAPLIDRDFSTTLAFESVEVIQTDNMKPQKVLNQILLAVNTMRQAASLLILGGGPGSVSSGLKQQEQTLNFEQSKLNSLFQSLQQTGDDGVMIERNRMELRSSVKKIVSVLKAMVHIIKQGFDVNSSVIEVPDNSGDRRILQSELLLQKVPLAESYSAVDSLMDYCHQNKASPSTLLREELIKIHPALERLTLSSARNKADFSQWGSKKKQLFRILETVESYFAESK